MVSPRKTFLHDSCARSSTKSLVAHDVTNIGPDKDSLCT